MCHATNVVCLPYLSFTCLPCLSFMPCFVVGYCLRMLSSLPCFCALLVLPYKHENFFTENSLALTSFIFVC